MKPYLKTTDDIAVFMNDNSYDFLCCDVSLTEDDRTGENFVCFTALEGVMTIKHQNFPHMQTDRLLFPIKDADVNDDIHQRVTKAIWDGLGGDKYAPMMHCVYISAAERMDDTFYVNVVRTKPEGDA